MEFEGGKSLGQDQANGPDGAQKREVQEARPNHDFTEGHPETLRPRSTQQDINAEEAEFLRTEYPGS